MSSSPNPPQAQSPPSTVPNEPFTKVVVPMPVIQQQDDIFYYVFAKGSLYARCTFVKTKNYWKLTEINFSDTHVFGLEAPEIQALSKKFNSQCKQVENGVMLLHPVCEVINSLAQVTFVS